MISKSISLAAFLFPLLTFSQNIKPVELKGHFENCINEKTYSFKNFINSFNY